MSMRTAMVLSTIVVMATAPDAAAAVRLARLPSLALFAADSEPAAYVGDRAVTTTPPGQPYVPRVVRSKHDKGGGSLAALGASSLPFELSLDPVSGRLKRLVYSTCVTAYAARGPTCAILSFGVNGSALAPTRVSDPPAEAQDRLPSGYAGAAAFSRSSPGSRVDELRYVPAAGGRSRRLRGGPHGAGAARLLGVALRGTTVAYVWRWQPTTTDSRYGVFTESVGGARRTVVTLDAPRGRILGPVWRGERVVFAVRRGDATRLYDFATRSRSLRSAQGPPRLATFAIAGRSLFWQAAAADALNSGNCGPSGCPLLRDTLPGFAAAPAGADDLVYRPTAAKS
jgi:hypothetical protein